MALKNLGELEVPGSNKSITMYRCTTWMRQQGTRVLQEKSFIRDTFSSCNNGTAGGRDRQLDRQIGVTSRIVEYDHCC